MSFYVWKAEEYKTDHENRHIADIVKILREEFENSKEECHLLCNFYIINKLVDVAILLPKGLFLIDLKNAGEAIIRATISNEWTDKKGRIIKAAEYKNPFQQIRHYRREMMDFLSRRAELFLNKDNTEKIHFDKFVKGWICFNPVINEDDIISIDIDECKYFNCFRTDKLLENLYQTAVSDLFLTSQQMKSLIEEIGLFPTKLVGNTPVIIENNENIENKDTDVEIDKDKNSNEETVPLPNLDFSPENISPSRLNSTDKDLFEELQYILESENIKGELKVSTKYIYLDINDETKAKIHSIWDRMEEYNSDYPCNDFKNKLTWTLKNPIFDNIDLEEEYSNINVSSLSLPSILKEIIYDQWECPNETDAQRVSSNIENNEEDTKWYLGTYFPRSFAEIFWFTSKFIKTKIDEEKSKEELNILDIGCGTGGASLGLLWSINTNYPLIKKVKIFGIDANSFALEYFKKIIDHLKDKHIFKFEIELHNINKNEKDILFKETDNFNKYFDFIISSKYLNEINENLKYFKFLNKYISYLNETGYLFLLDILKQNAPIELNKEASLFVKENIDKYSLLPSCLCNCPCKENCSHIFNFTSENILFTTICNKNFGIKKIQKLKEKIKCEKLKVK